MAPISGMSRPAISSSFFERSGMIRFDSLNQMNAKPQTKKVKDQNKDLAKKFGVQGYPTIVVLDPDGKEVARWGGYSQTFLADLKTKVDAAKTK